MDVNIGIKKTDRKAICDGLAKVLADTYMLYQKTHAYHWNVTGPMFSSLHGLFMTQYTELHDAADLIAERIRALGHYAPGSYGKYAKLTAIKDTDDDARPHSTWSGRWSKATKRWRGLRVRPSNRPTRHPISRPWIC